jgi:hypothetical protein
MEQSSKIPLVITKDSFSIKLTGKTAEALLQQPRPILWCNDGLYNWVPLVRVVNQVNVIKDKQTHAKANDLPFVLEFYLVWDSALAGASKDLAQAIELMSQQSNNNGSSSTNPSNDKSNT